MSIDNKIFDLGRDIKNIDTTTQPLEFPILPLRKTVQISWHCNWVGIIKGSDIVCKTLNIETNMSSDTDTSGLILLIFRSSVREDLMAACFVSQSVSQWVSVSNFQYTLFASFIFFLTQRRIRFTCGVLMPYNVGNIMRVDMLGSKVIKGVLLDET